MAAPLLLTLPYGPSMNAYWRQFENRTILSADGRKYKRVIEDALRRAGVRPFVEDVAVRLDLYRPQRSGDVDNRIKPVLDCLRGFAYGDDDQIVHLDVYRHDINRGDPRDLPRVEVEVAPLTADPMLFSQSADSNAYRKSAESIVSAINAIDANATLAAKGHLDKALEALAYFPGVLKKVVELPKPEPVPTPAVVAPRPVQAAGRPRVPHPRQVERQWPADAFRQAEGAGKK